MIAVSIFCLERKIKKEKHEKTKNHVIAYPKEMESNWNVAIILLNISYEKVEETESITKHSPISCEQTLASCHIANHYFQRSVGKAWLPKVTQFTFRYASSRRIISPWYTPSHLIISEAIDFLISSGVRQKNFVSQRQCFHNKNIGINFLVGGNFVTCTF